jgi:hypothetical protein
LSAFTFIIILLLLRSNITVFLYSVQSFTFKNYTWRISPRARRYDTNKNLASVFISPRGRVAQLYPQAPGTHFSRLLRHAWVMVGLFLFPVHHTGECSSVYLIKVYSFSMN